MLARILLFVCSLVVFAAASAFCQSVYRDIVVEADREPAPNFHAKTLTGEQFNNESTKGKVVLFQFWATWCRYCQSEESLVNDIATEFADQGLIVIAVDVAESRKKVEQYLKEHPRKCHIVLTGDTNLAAMYAATRYPIYVVVDREGKIVDTQHGAAGARRLRQTLARAGVQKKNGD